MEQPQEQPAGPEDYQLRLRELTEAANRYLERNGFQVSQKNGQRISTLVNDHDLSHITDSRPERWQDEVFVGRIPRDLFEDELLPFMEQAGPVRVIRLMMDFSGTTRGYAFVRYVNSADASFACQHLSDTKIRPDTEAGVGIKLSFDNKGLTFSGLPANTTAASLKLELSRILDGVEQVKLLKDTSPTKKKLASKLLTFEVQFKSHYCATQARRKLIPMLNKAGNRQYSVDWARPEPPAMNKARSPVSRPTAHLGLNIINNNNNNNNGQSITCLEPFSIWDSILNKEESLFGDATRNILLEINEPRYDPTRSITISNINFSRADLNEVKEVFEIDTIKITRVIPGQPAGTFTIEFETTEQAVFIFEAIILLPHCFKELSRNGDSISATWPYHNSKSSFSRQYL